MPTSTRPFNQEAALLQEVITLNTQLLYRKKLAEDAKALFEATKNELASKCHEALPRGASVLHNLVLRVMRGKGSEAVVEELLQHALQDGGISKSMYQRLSAFNREAFANLYSSYENHASQKNQNHPLDVDMHSTLSHDNARPDIVKLPPLSSTSNILRKKQDTRSTFHSSVSAALRLWPSHRLHRNLT